MTPPPTQPHSPDYPFTVKYNAYSCKNAYRCSKQFAKLQTLILQVAQQGNPSNIYLHANTSVSNLNFIICVHIPDKMPNNTNM